MEVSSKVREQSFQPLGCMRQGEITDRLREEEDLRQQEGVAMWTRSDGWKARLWMALKAYNNFEVDSDFDQEPVKLLEDGHDVVKGGGCGNTSSCRVLDQLELVEGFVRGTNEELVTINTGGDETLDQDGRCGVKDRWRQLMFHR